MAKKSRLLGQTDPSHLKHVAIGTLLSVFVFLGSFAVGDATMFLVNETSLLTAGPVSVQEGCGTNCVRGYPNDPPPPQPRYNPDNRWPGPFDGYWGADGKWYANADYNRDGKVDQNERDRWNATHRPITNEPIIQGGSGGSGTQKTSQNFLETQNAYMGGGCLSANPDDCY